MTTPTQAQIETILREKIRLVVRPDYDETETWMVKPGCIESIVAEIAALTAAAEVEGQYPNEATLRAVGWLNPRTGPDAAHPSPLVLMDATIERCAHVVNEWEGFIKDRNGLLARIRALKDKL